MLDTVDIFYSVDNIDSVGNVDSIATIDTVDNSFNRVDTADFDC